MLQPFNQQRRRRPYGTINPAAVLAAATLAPKVGEYLFGGRKQQPTRRAVEEVKRANNKMTNSVPLALNKTFQNRTPGMQAKGGSFRFKHKELLKEIVSTGATDVTTIPVNPGLFPWLSTVADAWDGYRFNAIRFSFEPSVATTSDGNIHLAFDGDMRDQAPSSVAEMMTLENAVVSRVWTSSAFSVPKRHLTRSKLVRQYALAGKPQIEYDVGNFYIASSGAPVGTIGNLFVEYEVVFSEPSHTSLNALSSSVTTLKSVASPAMATLVPYSLPLGTAANIDVGDGLKLVDGSSPTVLTLPPGTFDLEVNATFQLSALCTWVNSLGIHLQIDSADVGTPGGDSTAENNSGANAHVTLHHRAIVHLTEPKPFTVTALAVFAAGTVNAYDWSVIVKAVP